MVKLIKAHLDTQNQGNQPPGVNPRERTLILTVTLAVDPAEAERVLHSWLHKRNVDLYVVSEDPPQFHTQTASYGVTLRPADPTRSTGA